MGNIGSHVEPYLCGAGASSEGGPSRTKLRPEPDYCQRRRCGGCLFGKAAPDKAIWPVTLLATGLLLMILATNCVPLKVWLVRARKGSRSTT